MKVNASAKSVRMSPRKVNLVAGLIRGQSADRAKLILATTPQQATRPIGQVLASAVANAEHNFNLSPGELVVEQVLVGPARTMKRYRPRARGMAFTVRYRTSHISLTLSQPTAPSVDKPVAEATPPKSKPAAKPVRSTKAKPKTEPK